MDGLAEGAEGVDGVEGDRLVEGEEGEGVFWGVAFWVLRDKRKILIQIFLL